MPTKPRTKTATPRPFTAVDVNTLKRAADRANARAQEQLTTALAEAHIPRLRGAPPAPETIRSSVTPGEVVLARREFIGYFGTNGTTWCRSNEDAGRLFDHLAIVGGLTAQFIEDLAVVQGEEDL